MPETYDFDELFQFMMSFQKYLRSRLVDSFFATPARDKLVHIEVLMHAANLYMGMKNVQQLESVAFPDFMDARYTLALIRLRLKHPSSNAAKCRRAVVCVELALNIAVDWDKDVMKRLKEAQDA